jgi:hypothetical protein
MCQFSQEPTGQEIEQVEVAVELKLFVWTGVLTDYTAGIAFALAESVDHARDVIMQREGHKPYLEEEYHGTLWSDLAAEPDVYERPVGFAVWGGG